MHCLKFAPDSLPEIIMRFFVITAVGVVWCGWSIPVEGVDRKALNDIAEVRNCMKAMKEVQDDPEDLGKVKAFITLCEEFINELNLNETQIELLEKAGYKKGKKLKETVEEKAAKKDLTPDKKEETKDQSTSDKADDSGKDQERPTSEKLSEDDEDAASVEVEEDSKNEDDEDAASVEVEEDSKNEDDTMKDTRDTERQTVKGKKAKKQAAKSDEDKITETETQKGKAPASEPTAQGEQTDKKPSLQSEPIKQREQIDKKPPLGSESLMQEEQTDKKPSLESEPIVKGEKTDKKPSLESEPITQADQTDKKQVVEDEREQGQNPQENIPPFDLNKINDILKLTPEEMADVAAEFEQLRKNIKIPLRQHRVHKHVNFPDPDAQAIHEQRFGFATQDDQHFGKDLPKFQQQDWRAQFQDPAFGADIPKPTFQRGVPPVHEHVNFPDPDAQAIHGQRFGFAAQDDQHFGKDLPKFQQQDWRSQFQDPALGADIPKPTFQHGVPPVHKHEEFGMPFQHQHFDEGIPRAPKSAEWEATFPNHRSYQDIPQPNMGGVPTGNVIDETQETLRRRSAERKDTATPDDAFFTKRKIDEL